MTVSVSNTNLNDSFNTWRLNTNFAATVISNNVVTVARAGSANRGGVAKGNGHIAGTFTANELRTTTLKSGNTSDEGGWLYVNSNTSINATSLTVTANTTFQGNVDFVTSGTDRVVLGDISRVRVTGGSQGQFLRIDGESDTPNFKSLTLRDISDLSTNSAPIILSAANTTFSDNGDSPAIKFANANDSIQVFMGGGEGAAGISDLMIQLVDTGGSSRINITDSGNTIVAYIDSDGNVVTTSNFLPNADDASDLGSSGAEFKDLYLDGVAYIDELSMATGASQGVATSLIPKTDAVGNLGSTTRKWGTVWADNTNGGVGVFKSLGVSGALVVNGDITINSDNMTLDGNTVIGDATTDTVTFTAQVNSDFDPQTGSQRDMGATNNRWHNIYANNVIANNITTDNDTTINGNLTVNGTTIVASGQAFEADDGVFNTLGVTGTLTANGNVDLGNATTDSITVTGQFDSALIPITDDTYDLGTATKQWQDIWIDGTASIDVLSVDETSTFAGNATFNGDRVTVSGNGFFSDSIDVADSIDVTNSITNDGTVMLGKNGKLHANNTITNGTLTSAMLANTMAISTFQTHGSASQVPVISVNGKGQIIGISNTSVAGVTSFTYTSANNDLEIGTATGTTFNATIADATTSVKGVASFDSGDFDVSSGAVSLKNAATGAVLAINGTSNEVNVSRSNGTVTVGLPDDVTVTGQLNVGENVVVAGNLIVQGTTTTVDTATILLSDNIITLNSDETGSPSQNGGISIERGTSTNVQLIWNETSDHWETDGQTYDGRLVTTGDTAAGGALANYMTVANTQSLASARLGATATVQLTGDITGSASFSGNSVSISTTYNNDVVLGTDTSGNYVATITAGTGLASSGATTGEGIAHTLSVDLSELTDMTGTMVGTDEFIVLDAGADRRKAANEIGLSIFNNDQNFLVGGTDQRGNITQIGQDTNDYYSITTTQHRWFLDGAEDMRLDNSGNLDVEGSVTAFSATVSDERLKEDIVKVEDAVSKVQQLNGYTFTYKKDGKKSAGVIAQEVADVLPSAVRNHDILGGDGEYMVVEYDQLTALLIESIKELKAEIDDLKKNK